MDPTTTATTLIECLQEAWNAADGAAFGAPFAPDADFVTIRGELHSGDASPPANSRSSTRSTRIRREAAAAHSSRARHLGPQLLAGRSRVLRGRRGVCRRPISAERLGPGATSSISSCGRQAMFAGPRLSMAASRAPQLGSLA